MRCSTCGEEIDNKKIHWIGKLPFCCKHCIYQHINNNDPDNKKCYECYDEGR